MRTTSSLTSLALATASAVSASVVPATPSLAIEAGAWRCAVSNAVVLGADGRVTPADDVVRTFALSASNRPVIARPGEAGRKTSAPSAEPALDRAPVRRSLVVADALFSAPTQAFTSEDGGALYTSGGDAIVFAGDGAFVAFGVAKSRKDFGAILRILGTCARR